MGLGWQALGLQQPSGVTGRSSSLSIIHFTFLLDSGRVVISSTQRSIKLEPCAARLEWASLGAPARGPCIL